MNALQVNDLEIAGFNGSPLVECGETLPVLRRKSDGMHCVLHSVQDSATLTWHNENEAAQFASMGQWTRLLEPLALPRSCISEQDGRLVRQPMMVHSAHVLLEAAGRADWPSAFRGETFLWRRLEHDHGSLQAACGSVETVEALLDDWAAGLKESFDAMFREGRDLASLRRVADFMLCAGTSRSMRWQAYLRYAIAQEPERVRPTFEAFTRNEFPNVTWQEFLDHLKSLGDVLKATPVRNLQPTTPSSSIVATV